MKSLITIFGLLLLAQAASAAQNVFTYRTVLIEQSKPGNFCPDLVTISAVNQRNSLRGQAVHMTDSRGLSNVFIYESTTRECREDIICVSTNHFVRTSSNVRAEMKLNNDGQYPTTDLPGYSSLKISWSDLNTGTKKSCGYMLF